MPIFKKGEPKDISNYRPVAILSEFSKVFETLIHNSLRPKVSSKISESQHGFMKKRSTVTNLVDFVQYTSTALDSQGQVDVVYTDFAKAFDSVNHSQLVRKLSKFGCSTQLTNLFTSYLRDRSMFVEILGHRSPCFHPSSGVPQGSILGPLLFLMFINDITSRIEVEKSLFADDLKIFTKITSTNDCLALQRSLDKVLEWCHENSLDMNVDKCKVMSFTRRRSGILYNYSLGDINLERVDRTSDLGVVFDSELRFSHHITQCVSSSYRVLGFILRNTRSFSDAKPIISLYISLVRSKLEYASVVWNPFYNVHKLRIESVQRRFLKFVWFLKFGVYPERGIPSVLLREPFNLRSLEDRRKASLMVHLYKVLNNLIDSAGFLSLIKLKVPSFDARSRELFYVNTANTNVLLASPLHSMCSIYNQRCSNVDIFSTPLGKFIADVFNSI